MEKNVFIKIAQLAVNSSILPFEITYSATYQSENMLRLKFREGIKSHIACSCTRPNR
jgi:hypothetical protein